MDFFDRVEQYREYLVAEAEKQGFLECRTRVASANTGEVKVTLTATSPDEEDDTGCLPNATDLGIVVTVAKQVTTTTFRIREKR
jgi:hypothetical protein